MLTAIIAICDTLGNLDLGWYVYVLPVITDLVIIDKLDKGEGI